MKKENLDVLLEQMNGKFDLVLEGHEVLRSEIRDLSRKTDERFDLVDFKIDTLNKKIDASGFRTLSLSSFSSLWMAFLDSRWKFV